MSLKSTALTLPSRLKLTSLWRRLHPQNVPVLMLHGVLPQQEARYFNTTGKFIAPGHLRRLLERVSRQLNFISIEDYIAGLQAGRLPPRAGVLTFDDGYANNYTYAFPLLKEMGIPFAVFVVTGFVDTPRVLWVDRLEFAVFATKEKRMPPGVLDGDPSLGSDAERIAAIRALKAQLKRQAMADADRRVQQLCQDLQVDTAAPELGGAGFLTSSQIREMAAGGVVFGGHTVNHSILSREATANVRAEIRDCKRDLERITGKPAPLFAYPNGKRADFNDSVKQLLQQAGYAASLTSLSGFTHPGDDLFEIRRFAVHGRISQAEYDTRTSGLLEVLRGER